MCQHRVMPDGSVVIICRGHSRKKCSVRGCQRPGKFLCDWPVECDQTCDRALCSAHASYIRRETHYCPEHLREFQRLQEAHA